MAGDESSPAELDGHAGATPERLDAARRRPWLGIVCAICLVLAGLAWWVHAENPFNPYRDGTTHTAELINGNHDCPDNWGTSLPGYYWQARGVPQEWFPGPVEGKVHIIRQRTGTAPDTWVSAVFEARGAKVDLVGGRQPAFNDLTCSIR